MKVLKLVFIKRKHNTLRYMMFLHTKIPTLRKRQDNLRYIFIYKNSDTLSYYHTWECVKPLYQANINQIGK